MQRGRNSQIPREIVRIPAKNKRLAGNGCHTTRIPNLEHAVHRWQTFFMEMHNIGQHGLRRDTWRGQQSRTQCVEQLGVNLVNRGVVVNRLGRQV